MPSLSPFLLFVAMPWWHQSDSRSRGDSSRGNGWEDNGQWGRSDWWEGSSWWGDDRSGNNAQELLSAIGCQSISASILAERAILAAIIEEPTLHTVVPLGTAVADTPPPDVVVANVAAVAGTPSPGPPPSFSSSSSSRCQPPLAVTISGKTPPPPKYPRFFDLEYFQAYEIADPRNWKQHNIVLKWGRQQGELEGRTQYIFENGVPYKLPPMVHEKGTHFFFHEEAELWKTWCWQEMVAMLRAEDMKALVQGESTEDSDEVAPQSRDSMCDRPESRLASCRLQKTEWYDHKRHYGKPHSAGAPLNCTWDFVFTRDDGTEMFLHPNHSNTSIEVHAKTIHVPDLEIPASGVGGTSGPGTFRYFKAKNTTGTMKFVVPQLKGKGKGKDASSEGSGSSSSAVAERVGADH
jgi:hypothetical protein